MKRIPWILIFAILLQACTASPQAVSPANQTTVIEAVTNTPIPTDTSTPTVTATFTANHTATSTATFTPTFTHTETPTPTPDPELEVSAEVTEFMNSWLEKNNIVFPPEYTSTSTRSGFPVRLMLDKSLVQYKDINRLQLPSKALDMMVNEITGRMSCSMDFEARCRQWVQRDNVSDYSPLTGNIGKEDIAAGTVFINMVDESGRTLSGPAKGLDIKIVHSGKMKKLISDLKSQHPDGYVIWETYKDIQMVFTINNGIFTIALYNLGGLIPSLEQITTTNTDKEKVKAYLWTLSLIHARMFYLVQGNSLLFNDGYKFTETYNAWGWMFDTGKELPQSLIDSIID